MELLTITEATEAGNDCARFDLENKMMSFLDKPLAIVDIETTGDDEIRHEILEIGLLLVEQKTLSVITSANWLIKPHHIETAIPAALTKNGYNESDWKDALELSEVMPVFSEMTNGAVFTAFNVCFDLAFIKQAFRTKGVPNLMDYHYFDVLTLAWAMCGDKLERLNLRAVSELLNVPPEPEPHRAINGANTALEVLKKLKQ